MDDFVYLYMHFPKENICLFIQTLLKFISKVPFENMAALIQQMALNKW